MQTEGARTGAYRVEEEGARKGAGRYGLGDITNDQGTRVSQRIKWKTGRMAVEATDAGIYVYFCFAVYQL